MLRAQAMIGVLSKGLQLNVANKAQGRFCPPEGWVGFFNGEFIVSRRRIRSQPLAVYKHLLAILEAPSNHWIHDQHADQAMKTPTNPMFGHVRLKYAPMPQIIAKNELVNVFIRKDSYAQRGRTLMHNADHNHQSGCCNIHIALTRKVNYLLSCRYWSALTRCCSIVCLRTKMPGVGNAISVTGTTATQRTASVSMHEAK